LTFLTSSLLLRCWPCCPLSFFLWASAAGQGRDEAPRVGQGAALGRRDDTRREHAGEDEGANRGGGTLGKRIGESMDRAYRYTPKRKT
jgi:hypothetical protein